MLKLTKYVGFIAVIAITPVCAQPTTTIENPQDHFTAKGYDPAETLLSVGQSWEIYSGLSYIDFFHGTQNKAFQVSSTETDSLNQMNEAGAVGFDGGFSRVMMFENTVQTTMRGMAFGVLLHAAPHKFSGQVYQFQNPSQNNYTYTYEVMPLDIAGVVDLYFMKIYKLHAMPFFTIGGGFTAVNLSFRETAQNGALPSSAQSLTGWTATPMGIIGAGLEFELSQDWFLKTQYLYHYRGNAELKGGIFIAGVPVNLSEQSADVIAGYRF